LIFAITILRKLMPSRGTLATTVGVVAALLLASPASADRAFLLSQPERGALNVYVTAVPTAKTKKVYFTQDSAASDCVLFVSETPKDSKRVYRTATPTKDSMDIIRVSARTSETVNVFVSVTPIGLKGRCAFAVALLDGHPRLK